MNTLHQFLFQQENRWQWWFWGLILFLAPVEAVVGQSDIVEAVIFRFFGLFSKIMAAYLLAYYLIPKLLFQKRYLYFLLLSLLSVVVLCILARIINVHIAERIYLPDAARASVGEIITDYKFTINLYFNRVFAVALWFLFVKFGVDKFQDEQKMALLSQEKATAELNFLKAQIHPHFLFNTLNNLYTLTLEKSDEAPEVIIKLSNMLDYLLYQCNASRVSIQKEIELIQNYIGLESLRYGNRLQLSFVHEVDDSTIEIAPLLLLSPVENAFKHGTSGMSEPAWINISLTVVGKDMQFRVENAKTSSPIQDERNYTDGIGLKNIKNQLALTYPERHQLAIQDKNDQFIVDLKIQL